MGCAAVWGLFWIPLRFLQSNGFEGAWATVAYFAVGVIVLVPIMVFRRKQLRAGGYRLVVVSLFAGGAIALSTLSYLYTTVTKTLLIFYLTPVWSTLLGHFLLNEKLTTRRILAIVLGLAGLWVILAKSGQLPIPQNIGDWIALAAGVFWAFAAVGLRKTSFGVLEYLNAFMLSALSVSLLMLFLGGEWKTFPDVGGLSTLSLMVLAAVAIASLPVNGLILWSATKLSPGRVGLLMLFEVVVGIAVAALITEELYGIVEVTGTILILTAAAVDTGPVQYKEKRSR